MSRGYPRVSVTLSAFSPYPFTYPCVLPPVSFGGPPGASRSVGEIWHRARTTR